MSELRIMQLKEEKLLEFLYENYIEGETFKVIGYAVNEFEKDGEKVPYATIEVALREEWEALSKIGYEENANRISWSVRGYDGSDLSAVVGKVITVDSSSMWSFRKEFVTSYGKKESKITGLKCTIPLERLLAL